MIVERIREYLRTKDLGTANEEVLARVESSAASIGLRLAQNLSKQLLPYKKRPGDGGIRLYPSQATKCPRQLAYQVLDFPQEPFTVGTKLKFIIGDLIETAVLSLISAATTVVGNNADIDVKIGGKDRRGRSDGTVNVGRRKNLEIKSMSSFGFKKFVEDGIDDTWGYLGQANVYMRTKLELKQIDEPGATLFVASNRDTGELHELEVPYEPKYAHLADLNFAHVENSLEANKLPNRPYELGAGGKLPLLCSYCSMKYSCFASPAQRVGFDENGQPQYADNTTRRVVQYFEKGARGGARPAWRVSEE